MFKISASKSHSKPKDECPLNEVSAEGSPGVSVMMIGLGLDAGNFLLTSAESDFILHNFNWYR